MRRGVTAALLLLGTIAAPARGSGQTCASDATLCLGDGARFHVEASWREANGTSGAGHAVALTANAGYFWFFDSSNVELVVKALDGCTVNGHFWFFSTGLTNLGISITVTDTLTGQVSPYDSPAGTPYAAILDTLAFGGCPTVPLLVTLSRYKFSPGGPDGPPIELDAGTTYLITFHSEDVEHGISAIPQLGIESRSIPPGNDYVVQVTPTEAQRGLYNFACTRVCGGGHGGMHGALEVR
jgi:heme/copper-type cytochrome/quinol oxidase subunit 2